MPLAWLAKPVSHRLVLVTRIFPLIVFIYQRSTHLIRQSYPRALSCNLSTLPRRRGPRSLYLATLFNDRAEDQTSEFNSSSDRYVFWFSRCLETGRPVGWLEFTGTFNTDRLYHVILLWGHFLLDHPACTTITGFFFLCSYCIYYKVRSTFFSDAVVHCHRRAKGYFKPRKIHTKRWRIYGAKEGRKSSVVPQSIVCRHSFNKKVSHRKQIARQHSCHQKFWPEQGHDRPCKLFLSSSFIIVQNLVTVSIVPHVEPPKKMKTPGHRPRGMRRGWPYRSALV